VGFVFQNFKAGGNQPNVTFKFETLANTFELDKPKQRFHEAKVFRSESFVLSRHR